MIPVAPHFISPLLLVGCTSLLLACNSGQIGGEVSDRNLDNGGTAGEGDGACEDGEITMLSPQEVSSLGFAPADAVALAAGSHAAPLAWGNLPAGISLTLTPAAGEGQIEVEVTVDSSTVRLVDRVPVENDSSGDGTETGLLMDPVGGESGCPDEVRFDAQVRILASNGALNDTFAMTFIATSPYQARGSIPVTPGDLSGSFDVSVSDAHSEAVQTALSITFTPGGMTGTLGGIYQTTGTDLASATPVTYGSFPIEGCQTGAIVGADSDFASEMIAILDGLPEFNLTWSDAEPTALTLSHEVETVCFESGYSGEDSTAVLQLQTAISSADGRINGTWQLEARVTLPPDGTASEIAIIRQGYLGSSFSEAEFESQTGISGVTLPEGKTGTFSFGILDDLTDETPASGTLTTYAITAADCRDQEPVVDPDTGESSTAGCAGNSQEALETAALTAR